MKRIPVLLLLLAAAFGAYSQPLIAGPWKAELLRADGHPIVFNFTLSYAGTQPVIHILNAEEKLEVRQISIKGDSVFMDMPFFESAFFLRKQSDGSLSGKWVKGTSSANNVVMPFIARPGKEARFVPGAAPVADISGKWEMTIIRPNGTPRPAIADLVQEGSLLTGSILTPSGDYRFLEGIVKGDSLFLSTFDGSHAYVFHARIVGKDSIDGGSFYSGPTHLEKFSAIRNPQAKLPVAETSIFVKPGQEKLNFRFPDLQGKLVGITDERFRNKVVVVQLMGSWCPNCMDETAFLSKYYQENKHRGIEMVALAYEYSLDPERTRRSLGKFQQRFQVGYPMLITPVTSADTLRTEKTLPQLTPIKVFPSTIFIGKDGKVKKIHSGFYGPATGDQYTQYKTEFEATIRELLAE